MNDDVIDNKYIKLMVILEKFIKMKHLHYWFISSWIKIT